MHITELLEAVPEFADFSRSDLDTLEHILLVRDYPDGHVFIREGKSPHDVYLIIEGQVAVTHSHDDDAQDSVELKRMHAGELFGLVALIDHGQRSANCRAVGTVRVASLPRAAFELMYNANSPLAGHFLRIVARQLMRDYRTLVLALRQNIFETDYELMSPDLPAMLSRYAGPERRKEQRRMSTDQ